MPKFLSCCQACKGFTSRLLILRGQEQVSKTFWSPECGGSGHPEEMGVLGACPSPTQGRGTWKGSSRLHSGAQGRRCSSQSSVLPLWMLGFL